MTQPWLRYELLATLSRLADWNLKEHSLRCTFAAGDLRAHGQLILEEFPDEPDSVIGVYIYDHLEFAAVSSVKSVLSDFFGGGHWAGSLLPTRHDPVWEELMTAAETARLALIMNGLPAWDDHASRREA